MIGRSSHEEAGNGEVSGAEPGATRGDAPTTTAPPAGDPRHASPPDGRRDGAPGDEPGTAARPAAHDTVGPEHMRAIRARQRDEFGGFAWGSAFFGWLVAFGVAALLSGLLAAADAAIGLTDTADQETVGLAGGIALVAAVSLAYFCGGYVAGRLARFDGGRNGFGVWVIGILVTLALGALAVAAGDQYNVLDRASLPRLTVGEETATTAGIVAMAAMLALTALAAIAGGKAGERYHTRIDRHAVA